MAMSKFIIHRALQAFFVLVVVTVCVAFAVRLTGDPVIMMSQQSAAFSEADLMRIREALGLNQSFFQQYIQFAAGLLTGNLGTSFFRGEVSALIGQALPATALLAFCSMALSVAVSIPLGIYAAVYKNGLADQIIRVFSLVGLSFPNFWLAMMFVLVLSITFPIFPASGFFSAPSLVLPTLTIALILTATNVRLVRTTMLETLSQQYVMVARAKGLREWVVIYKHALRNSAIALVTYMGLQFGNLIGGIVIVELVFNWPGMGTLAIDAISQRDYPVLQATVSILAIVIVGVNLAVDIVYGLIDPRIRVN